MSLAKYLNTDETAALARTTRGAIYASRHRGEPPGALGFTSGKKLLFRRSDVEQWLEQRRRTDQQATAERRRRRTTVRRTA